MLLNKNLEQISAGSSDNCLLITLPNCFIVRVSKKEDKQQFDDFFCWKIVVISTDFFEKEDIDLGNSP